MGPIHWDDTAEFCFGLDPLRGRYSDLGTAAGSVEIGVGRYCPEPGCQTTPAHVEGGEEEISYVVSGSGWSWIDGRTYAIAAGDCIVHRVDEGPHTVVAGDEGIEVLAFGERASRGATTWLPRAGVLRVQETWVQTPGGPHPWRREVEAGRVELGEPQPRPERIVALADVPEERRRHGATDLTWRVASEAAGAVRTGLRRIAIAAGAESMPPHVHTAEEELYVVLEGSGVATVGDAEHAVRRGSVLAFPPGGEPHALVAGDDGLVFLAYGQRDPRDVAWYPRSRKLSFRGLGIRLRVSEPLDYWDGEPG